MKKLAFISIVLMIIAGVLLVVNKNETVARLVEDIPIFWEDLTLTKFIVPSKVYMVPGEEMELDIVVEEVDGLEVGLELTSSNQRVLSTNKNILKAKKDGEVNVTVRASNGEKREITVIVTSLISTPTLDNDKPYISCGEYTEEEAKVLEEILEYKIESAGYQTRGGALAAARFLILEFKNGIRYFNENGRLENHSNIKKIDGEGRFYHKGLYITEDKYEEIEYSSEDGPKMWGCPLKNSYFNKKMENGLSCSGFITWALLNAGYDVGDVGAGDYSYVQNELLDIRPKEEVSLKILESGRVNVGDLIGFDGHIAMIIGMDENHIYVGESYETGLRVRTFTYNELVKSEFTDIILMDDFYKNDGKYTQMW